MFKIISIFFALLQFVSPKTLEIYGPGVPVQQPYIPLTDETIVQNYKKFASNLVNNEDLTDVVDGVIFSPFNVGHALAVLHEQVVLNVSTKGFNNALEIPELQIRNSYRDMIRTFARDPKISINGTIYTQEKEAQLTVGIGMLKTKVNLVDPKLSHQEYVEFVNDDLNNKTKFGIPVPAFGNQKGASEGDYFATTFTYKSQWENKWVNVAGRKSFNALFTAETTQYMETTGRFDYFSNDEFELVKIPMQGGSKNLLLAKPKTPVELWDHSAKNVWEPFVSTLFTFKRNQWSPKMLKVEVPVFQYLSGASYFTQLKQLGITESMCLPAEPGRNSLDQIAQISKVDMGPEELTLTVITGTKDNVSAKDKVKARKLRDTSLLEEFENRLATHTFNTSPNRARREAENSGNAESLVFDHPYFWALEDQEIGPLALGAILLPVERKAIKLSPDFMEEFLQCDKVKQD